MLDFLRVFAWFIGRGWVGDKEGVLLVAGGMLLGDEEGVEVPEAGLNIPKRFTQLTGKALRSTDSLPVGGHLLKTHLKEDLSELMSYFVHYRPTLAG